jgi:hypothetical protein
MNNTRSNTDHSLDPRTKKYAVGLASSQDGLKWVKQNKGQPVFLGGAAGDWDSGGALRRCVTRIDGVQHMFYEGVVSARAYFSV